MPKSYSSQKVYSQNYLKRVKYIPCEEATLPFFLSSKNSQTRLNWFFKSKVEIDKIKLLENKNYIDKETFNSIS